MDHRETSCENLPLLGLRVVDFTSALSGPYATQTLGDLGADVIKIERPAGDDSRSWGPPFVGGTASYFLSINRNKRSIALDLKTSDGQQTAHELITRADILVENFRPGVAARLGIGYDTARQLNSSVVYCSISGFGATLPSRPGYDQVVQASSGWMSLTGFPDSAPLRAGVPVGDVATGMAAVQAILAAVIRRDKTGAGAYVDIAMQDTLVSMLAYQAARYFATGSPPKRTGNEHPTVAPYGVFRTADGEVILAVGNDQQFARLATAINRPALSEDPRFMVNRLRAEHRGELNEVIEAALCQFETDDVLRLLSEAGVPCGRVNELGDVLESEESRARDLVLPLTAPGGEPFRSPGGFWHIDGMTAQVWRPPPALDQHGEEIRSELGMNPASSAFH